MQLKTAIWGSVLFVAFVAVGTYLGHGLSVAIAELAFFTLTDPIWLYSVIKRDLSGMGKWLFVGAMVLMVGAIINIFVGSSAGMMAISVAAIGIFSAFMLYDLKQIMDGGETNYISATLALYLDLFNIFQSLLMILGITSGDD